MSTLAPGQSVGPFTVRDVLGCGGQSTVYRGRHDNLVDDAAVKVATIEDHDCGERVRARLMHQARVLDSMSGHHVPTLIDLDVTGDQPYLAMTLAGTRSLATRLREQGPLMLSDARPLIIGVADALQRIHDCGILHLDLTPANVVLDGDTVRVVDFGAAVALSEVSEEHARTFEGTSGYVALERCLGALPTPQMDVFSLGALTYRALIGIRPYADSRSLAATRRLSPKALTPPVMIRPDIGPYLSDLLMRTLALDPGKRPATPREFAEAFAMALPQTRVR